MNRPDVGIKLLANEPRLEETAIKGLMHSEVNKKAKREVQRILVRDLSMQSV